MLGHGETTQTSQPDRFWLLEPEIVFLNHGSFGACPRAVLEHQNQLRERMERDPVRFFVRELPELLAETRVAVAELVRAAPQDLVFLPNATSAVNSVLRSLSFGPDDELLTTNHEYGASRNALEFVARRSGARLVIAEIPFPIASPEEVLQAVLDAVSSRTRLALVDAVTSQTGLVMPLARLVAELHDRGVDTLVDGAHAPGMLPLDLDGLAAAYFTGNCHKWLCAPKGAAFLHVRRDRQDCVRPLSISHGYSMQPAEQSRYQLEFDWLGTDDPTAILSVPKAIQTMSGLLPGGWDGLRQHNHELVCVARRQLCDVLAVEPPCPEAMLGSMASLPLPDGSAKPLRSPLYTDELQDELLERFGIEVPVIPWPAPPRRLLRISAQIYNIPQDYTKLATALTKLL